LLVENVEEVLKMVSKDGIKVVMEGNGYGLEGDAILRIWTQKN